MKVLLDECTPAIVKRLLPHRDIKTVQEMGWNGVKNGELLKAAESQFDVFITSDKNLRYQQNLAKRACGILQLPTNRVPVVETLMPAIDAALDSIRPGDFVEIPFPS
jgi:predicted nuclease of predicted toxin-antitoxin system